MSYQCHECPYKTDHWHEMRRHTERHEQAVFTCDDCNMPFRAKTRLTAHQRQVHSFGKSAGKFAKNCVLCPYSTLFSGDLARHRRKHTKTDFHCKYCNYPFANKALMKAHEKRIHESIESKQALTHTPKRSEGSKSKRRDKHTANDTSHKQVKHVHGEKKREYIKLDFSKHRIAGSAKYKEAEKHKSTDKNMNASLNVHKEENTYSERNIRLNKNDIPCVKTSNEHYREKRKGHKDSRYDSEKRNKNSKRSDRNRPEERLKSKMFVQVEKKESNISIDDDTEETYTNKPIVLTDTSDISLSSIEDIGISLEPGDSSDDDIESPREFETMTVMLADDTLAEAMRCRKCIFFSTRKDEFIEHIDLHRHGPLTCSYCKMPFRLQENLDKHMKDKHDSDSDSTDTSKSSSELNVSERTSVDQGTELVYDVNEMSCVFCNFKTHSYMDLKNHIDGHLGDESDAIETKRNKHASVLVETDEYRHHDDDRSPTQKYENKTGAHVTNENVDEDGYYYTATRIHTDDAFSPSSDEHVKKEKDTRSITNTSELHGVNEEPRTEYKQDCDEIDGGNETSLQVTGRLDKESFKKTKKLYAKVLEGDRVRYECLVCEKQNMFDSKGIWQHFKKHHKKLRRRICNSCPFCSKSFPKKPK